MSDEAVNELWHIPYSESCARSSLRVMKMFICIIFEMCVHLALRVGSELRIALEALPFV